MYFKNWNKKIKKLDMWDMGLVKLSVAAVVLFLISIWTGFANWIQNTNSWWFLAAAIVFAIRPQIKVWCRR